MRRVAQQLQTRLPANVTLDELISAGNLGLVEAVDRFDPERGVSFAAFARTRIRGAMIDWLRELDMLPRSTRDRVNELARVTRQAEGELGRRPTEAELVERMGISHERLARLRSDNWGGTVLGFDDVERDREERTSLLDRLADDSAVAADDHLATRELHGALLEAMASLSERLRLVVTLYYAEDMKMQEIAGVLGVTVGRVSQLHTDALRRLREQLSLDGDYDERQLALLLGRDR